MTESRKKAKSAVPGGLAALAPNAAAALEAQVARLAAALEAGQDLEELGRLVGLPAQEALWDLHFMARLAALHHPAIPALLVRLYGSAPDKERRKGLKRAWHLLKTRGVAVPEELWPRETAAPVQKAAAVHAYVTPVLSNGERVVILEGPRAALGGNFLVARLSDRSGFRECHLLDLKRQHQKEFWQNFGDQGLERLPVAPAYAVRLLAEAYALAPDSPGASRYGALTARIWAHWGRPGEAPDLEQVLPELSLGDQGRFLEQSRELPSHPLFRTWLPGLEEITPWLQRLQEAQQSPLVLSEPQKRQRQEAVVDEATQALYPPEGRPAMRRRLQEMAYYLDLKGQGDEARAAQAAAEDLKVADRGLLSGENPFLNALVWNSLRLAWELSTTARGAETPPGLIAPPTESLIYRR